MWAKTRSEVKVTSLLLCIKTTPKSFLTPLCSIGQIIENPSVYAALSDFCVIITRASIFLTIPVAFIYTKISLLYKFVLLVSVKQGDLYLLFNIV